MTSSLLRTCSELGDEWAVSSAGHTGAVPELEVSAFTWASFLIPHWAVEQSLSKSLWFWKKIQNV